MVKLLARQVSLIYHLTLFLFVFAGVAGIICPVTRGQQSNNRQLVQNEASTSQQRRVALVIGNGAYVSAPVLKNPPNDARDIAATLKSLDFDVSMGIDLDQRGMKKLVREFGLSLRSGGQGVFYYAGHGVQLRGHNYLVPVNADIQTESDVEDQGVDVSYLLDLLDEAGNGLNIVILDACRNNPFARSFRSASSGLAQIDAPTGTLIAYATSPGRVARDGEGKNGTYTAELLKQIRVPGVSVEEMFKRVRASVQRQTSGQQIPWESSSLIGNFTFSPSGSQLTAVPKATGTVDAASVEREFWESIRTSNDPEDFREYLRTYPSGIYAALAKNNIRRLEAAKNSKSVVSPETDRSRRDAQANEAQRNAGPEISMTADRSIWQGSETLEGTWVADVPPNRWYDTGIKFRPGTVIFINFERGSNGTGNFRVGECQFSIPEGIIPEGYGWLHFYDSETAGSLPDWAKSASRGVCLVTSPTPLFLFVDGRTQRIRFERRRR